MLLQSSRPSFPPTCPGTLNPYKTPTPRIPPDPPRRPSLDLEDSNRKLQAAADQAAKDDAEVSGLIEKHQRLLESTKELQVGGESGGRGRGGEGRKH